YPAFLSLPWLGGELPASSSPTKPALASAVSRAESEGAGMSIDAIHIAQRAELAVLPLLTELLASGEQENRIALGELYSGDQYIQVQLIVTSKQEDLLDDDSVMGDEA